MRRRLSSARNAKQEAGMEHRRHDDVEAEAEPCDGRVVAELPPGSDRSPLTLLRPRAAFLACGQRRNP
jgi:hypothetical protein